MIRHIRSTGFTLIELVLVMVLIGIVAAVVGPRFFSNSTFTQDRYTQGLLNALRYAHEEAVSSGCDVQLSLSSTSYSLTTDTNCLSAAPPPALTTPVISPFGNNTYQDTAPGGMTVSGALGTLIFAPDGTIHTPLWNSSSPLTLSLTATGSTFSRSFTLYGLSGYVQ